MFFLVYAELVFLGLFVFEMGIRMYALGLAAYFSSAFNRYISCLFKETIVTIQAKTAMPSLFWYTLKLFSDQE